MTDEGSSVTLIFYRINPKWWTEPALNLASAVSGGAIPYCKSIGLKGCPASAIARKSVAKALKKAKAQINAAAKK